MTVKTIESGYKGYYTKDHLTQRAEHTAKEGRRRERQTETSRFDPVSIRISHFEIGILSHYPVLLRNFISIFVKEFSNKTGYLAVMIIKKKTLIKR